MLTLFLLMVSGYVFGGLAALLGSRSAVGRWLAAAGAAFGSIGGLALGFFVIASGTPLTFTSARLLPLTGVAIRLDGLGGVFLFGVGFVGCVAAVFAVGCSAPDSARFFLPLVVAMFNLLHLSLPSPVVSSS